MRKRTKPRRRHQYGPDWGRSDQRKSGDRRDADQLRDATPHEIVQDRPSVDCDSQVEDPKGKGRRTMSDEKSDKILADLAQVQEVIADVREEVHRIQRETPYPVP